LHASFKEDELCRLIEGPLYEIGHLQKSPLFIFRSGESILLAVVEAIALWCGDGNGEFHNGQLVMMALVYEGSC